MRPIYGCHKNFRDSLHDYAHDLFPKKFSRTFVLIDYYYYYYYYYTTKDNFYGAVIMT